MIQLSKEHIYNMNSSILFFCCILFVKIFETPRSFLFLFLYSHEDSHPSAFLLQLKLIGLSFLSTWGVCICTTNFVSDFFFGQNMSITDHSVTSHSFEMFCLNLSLFRIQTDIKMKLYIIGRPRSIYKTRHQS